MKRAFRFLLMALFVSVVSILVIVGYFRPGLLRGTPNDGHQLGGDISPNLPGNTIECFKTAIKNHESKPSYRYSECDIRETADNRLVVFHDWDISSVPNTAENREALGQSIGQQAVKDLTLQQLQSLRLEGDCQIPTLQQVLDKAVELGPAKPLLLEIKYLHSDQGRQQLLESARRVRDSSQMEVHFLAFIRNIKRSFPEPEAWLDEVSRQGFRVYQVYRPKTKEYDLCETWN